MKILLTGDPRSGKTTVLARLLMHAPNKFGMLTAEAHEQLKRVGFDLIDHTGRVMPLARIDSDTTYHVGQYSVDVRGLKDFIPPLFNFGPEPLLYIDEIGEMELLSSEFQKLATTYVDAPNDLIGTVSSIFSNAFTQQLSVRLDIMRFTVSQKNRELLADCLRYAIENAPAMRQLTTPAHAAMISLANQYGRDGKFIQLQKLFKNAVPYVAQGKIHQLSDGSFSTKGFTNTHKTTIYKTGDTVCDCDLFNGRGEYSGRAGECSHIQAAILVLGGRPTTAPPITPQPPTPPTSAA